MNMDDPSAEDAAWTLAARPVTSPLCDAFFLVAESVYVGPESGMTPTQWEAERIPLPRPNLPLRAPSRVAAADVAGKEDVLAAHYDGLIRVAQSHGRTRALAEPFPFFAIRPALLDSEEVLASWPWSDTLPEALGVLEVLSRVGEAAPGRVILDELEQGWGLRIVAGQGTICLVEWDGEGPPPADAAWCLEASVLAGQAAEARDRLRSVHVRLTQLLGWDFWS
ncbi:hypothetical protein [Roseomonas sp. KE2513]|uniref:hypothetical protein n=1 Tax=Roseomonas sp. KE2513 TaxID=2479202 RepID=UPI0018E00E9A|nr:hypothetical protein [Roseomonas sp. KE2513]